MRIKPLTINRLVIETVRSEMEFEQFNFQDGEAVHLQIPPDAELFVDGKSVPHTRGHLVYIKSKDGSQ